MSNNMIRASEEMQMKLFMLRRGLRFKTGKSWKHFCAEIKMTTNVAKKIHDAPDSSKVKIYKSSRDQIEAAYRKWFNE